MLVDTSTEKNLRIAFNLTMPALPCAGKYMDEGACSWSLLRLQLNQALSCCGLAISVDNGDLSGTHETDTRFARHLDIHKIRLDSFGHIIMGNGKRKEYMAPISIEDYAFGHVAATDLKGTLKVMNCQLNAGSEGLLFAASGPRQTDNVPILTACKRHR